MTISSQVEEMMSLLEEKVRTYIGTVRGDPDRTSSKTL